MNFFFCRFLLCTDNEDKMVKMKELLQNKYPELTTCGCSPHHMNLLEQGVTPNSVLKHRLEVNKFFRNHHQPHLSNFIYVFTCFYYGIPENWYKVLVCTWLYWLLRCSLTSSNKGRLTLFYLTGMVQGEGGKMPQLPNDTRWNSQVDCVESYVANYNIYLNTRGNKIRASLQTLARLLTMLAHIGKLSISWPN